MIKDHKDFLGILDQGIPWSEQLGIPVWPQPRFCRRFKILDDGSNFKNTKRKHTQLSRVGDPKQDDDGPENWE